MQWCFAANSHTKKANLPAVTWPNNYLCVIKKTSQIDAVDNKYSQLVSWTFPFNVWKTLGNLKHALQGGKINSLAEDFPISTAPL